MNLVFFDRRSAAQPALGEAFLNVQPGGACLLSSGAVANHQLQEQRWVSVAKDNDTNRFFLVFGAGSPESKPFALRSQKNKPSVRTFSAAGAARLLCQAFGLGEAKSLRLAVGQPEAFEQQQLFPLQLEGTAPAVVPVAPAPAPAPTPAPAPIVEASEAAAASTPAVAGKVGVVSTFTPEQDAALLEEGSSPAALAREWDMPTQSLYNRRSYLKKQPAASKPATVVEPVREDTSTPARKTFGLVQRAEELTAYWYEREISKATPNELGEVLNLLRHVSKEKRGFEMNLVLERAEAEHTERLKGAGKGGNRG